MSEKIRLKKLNCVGKKSLLIFLVGACCVFGGCQGQRTDTSTADESVTGVSTSVDVQLQVNSSAEASAQNGGAQKPEYAATSADLYCEEITLFSGMYVENGENEKVENVAAILVHNRSKVFLDRATITYKYGTKNAVFQVTGLPAGEKCWVMEKNKMEVDGKHKFEFKDCVSAFNNNAIERPEHIITMTKDNVITVTNNSKQTLENVCVYYKNTFEDGNYFGGITYVLNFGKLAPGETLEKASAHFSKDSEIVKYSYQV